MPIIQNHSRREFVKTALTAGAGILLGPKVFGTDIQSASRLHPLNVFAKCLQFLDYDRMAEVIARVGFDGADLPVRPAGAVLPEKVKTDLPRAQKALAKNGKSIPMIVTSINDPDDRYTEEILGTAAQAGIKYYRMGYFDYDKSLSIQQNLDVHKKQTEKLEKINRKYGIHGGYQNHSGTRVGAPVWDLHWLLKDADPEFIGVQYDVCHAVTEGGVSWPLGMKLLAPWIKTIAIKDFIWKKEMDKWRPEYVPLTEGMVDFQAYLKACQALRIAGPVSIHYEYHLGGAEHGKPNPTMSLNDICAYLKKDLSWLRKQLEGQDVS